MNDLILIDLISELQNLSSGINERTRRVLIDPRAVEMFLQAIQNIGKSIVSERDVEPQAQYELEEILRTWITSTGTDLDVPVGQILTELQSRGWKIIPPS